MTTERKTLTVDEAATLLGISRNSAYRAVRDGDIPSVRVRRRLLVPADRLHALLTASPAEAMPIAEAASRLRGGRSRVVRRGIEDCGDV